MECLWCGKKMKPWGSSGWECRNQSCLFKMDGVLNIVTFPVGGGLKWEQLTEGWLVVGPKTTIKCLWCGTPMTANAVHDLPCFLCGFLITINGHMLLPRECKSNIVRIPDFHLAVGPREAA